MTSRWNAAGWIALLASSVACAATARADDKNLWAPGSNWLYVRAGYAHSSANGSGNGGAGYGVGFRHFLNPSHVNDWKVLGIKPLGFLHWTLFRRWSIGGFVEYDVIGRYGSASDVEIPAAVELTRHIMWKSVARPYVTLGVGPFYRKLYNTGDDFSIVRTSGFLATGVDAPIAPHQMLGFDVRLARVMSENVPANPVFGGGELEASHWSMKLSYAVAY